MITELRLENWKSFGEATLHIDPLSVLIGTNASGKSNVVDALLFLYRIAQGHPLQELFDGLKGGLDWVAKRPQDFFSVTTSIRHSESVRCTYTLECTVVGEEAYITKESFKLWNNDELEKVREFLNQDRSLLLLSSDFRDDSEPDDYVEATFNDLRKVFVFAPNTFSMGGFSRLREKLKSDASNIAGVLASLPVSQKKVIEETMTNYASRLPERDISRVYAEAVGKLGKDAMLYCDECWSDTGEVFTVDARAMSDGTLRFLAILTALLTLEEGSLLVIDEVDNGLHPSRANLLLEALRDIGKQRKIDVLVTTHNPALLDALGTESVPFVTVAHRDTESGDSKLTLLEDIEQLPKLLAQGTIGKLSSRGLIEKSLESSVSE